MTLSRKAAQLSHLIHVISATVSQSDSLEPLVWGSPRASAGYKLGMQGTLPTPGWLGHHGSGRVAIWDGHPGFFGEGADGRDDNDLFRIQLIDWLRDDGMEVAFSRSHGEKPMNEVFSGVIWQELEQNAAATREISDALTIENLADVDLLVMGSSWNRLEDGEDDAIEDYVLNGGGLLVIGIGWAYAGYADDPDPDLYIPNLLGERFGWRVMFSTISDP